MKSSWKLHVQIDNLVGEIADGQRDSPAIRRSLAQKKAQAEALELRVQQNRQLLEVEVDLPDDAWIQEQLADLSSVLSGDEKQAANLLRKLLGRVIAHQVLPPGKTRGYSQLRFRVSSWEIIEAVLGDKLPAVIAANMGSSQDPMGGSQEFVLDVGGPTRMDLLGPVIAKMRAEGKPWKEVWKETGLGSGPAYVCWKRFVDSQRPNPDTSSDRLQPADEQPDSDTDAA